MLFQPLCYFKRVLFSLKHILFRLEKYHDFSRVFLGGQLCRLEDTKRNALDISDFRNHVHHKTFLREYLDRLYVNYQIFILILEAAQPPGSLKRNAHFCCFPEEGNFGHQNNICLKTTYFSNAFFTLVYSMRIFAAVIASLVKN